MVTNIRHHTVERHSKLWRRRSYIMTHKWPGITLRSLRFIYSVKSISDLFIRWSQSKSEIDPGAPLCESWSTSSKPQTCHIRDIAPAAMWSASPEYDYLATDFTCEIHDWGNENPIGLLWGLTVCPRVPCHLLQHVGKISAVFLRPTRHRVVSAIYGTPIIYNWKQANDTAA